jgi:hypothetical protein
MGNHFKGALLVGLQVVAKGNSGMHGLGARIGVKK